jgi:putative Ca2+/H+ antiporter (TMEM165/GDT1 family)
MYAPLAARYTEMAAVVAGTTFGMLLANVPAVYFGERIANKVPLRLVHGIAAGIFAVLGVATLLGGRRRVRFLIYLCVTHTGADHSTLPSACVTLA